MSRGMEESVSFIIFLDQMGIEQKPLLMEEWAAVLPFIDTMITNDYVMSAFRKLFREHDRRGLDLLIKHTTLSVHAINCLRSLDIDYIGQLVQSKKKDLEKEYGIGVKTLSEIEVMLARYQLRLDMDLKKWNHGK